MSKLDNKQMIHIATEVVVLLGISFYFSSKNKKLAGLIEELGQRLEEQEDHIQKLETNIQQMSQHVGQLTQSLFMINEQMGKKVRFSPPARPIAKPVEKPKRPVVTHVAPTVTIKEERTEILDEPELNEEETEDDDLEIQEELQELDDLKKEQ